MRNPTTDTISTDTHDDARITPLHDDAPMTNAHDGAPSANAQDYARIEAAIAFLEAHFREQPDLATVAASVGLSPYHFQRLFRHWAGISPKRFAQFLTLDYAKGRLAESRSVLDVTYDAGLSGPGRLHDLFVTYEAMTPGEFKAGGAGLDIAYGVHPSPFGPCLIGETARGICALGFADGAPELVRAEFARRWPEARFRLDPERTGETTARIFSGGNAATPLRLCVWGTSFQLKVWEALLRIPTGHVVSYDALGESLGLARSARAVGGAVAANPISYVIPCHRVIRKSGRFSNYEWGPARKRAMLGWEAARRARRAA